MLKSILNFSGGQQLSKKKQLNINGGSKPTLCAEFARPLPPGMGLCLSGRCPTLNFCQEPCSNGTLPICYGN